MSVIFIQIRSIELKPISSRVSCETLRAAAFFCLESKSKPAKCFLPKAAVASNEKKLPALARFDGEKNLWAPPSTQSFSTVSRFFLGLISMHDKVSWESFESKLFDKASSDVFRGPYSCGSLGLKDQNRKGKKLLCVWNFELIHRC
jgi:hypothetical protein